MSCPGKGIVSTSSRCSAPQGRDPTPTDVQSLSPFLFVRWFAKFNPGGLTWILTKKTHFASLPVSPLFPILLNMLCPGYADMQIIPRYATYVYYNCYTGDVSFDLDRSVHLRRNPCTRGAWRWSAVARLVFLAIEVVNLLRT